MAERSKDEKPIPTYRRGFAKTVWYWFSSTGLWVLWKLFFRLRTENRLAVPSEGPVVLLANHTSHLDPPLMGGATRRQLSYLARDTLFVGPFGWLIRSYDAVPVDRDGHGLAGIRATLKRLKQGAAVVLFPEGTRSPDGRLQEFKPGFIALVRRSKAAIVPVGIDGAYEAWPRGVGRPRFFRPIAMHYGTAISPSEVAELDDERLLALVTQRVGESAAAARRLNGRPTTPPAEAAS